MNWWSAASKVALLVVLAATLGWYYGRPMEAVALALFSLVLFWLRQLRYVQRWLENPDQPPPDIYGLWGDLLARIYLNQRRNKETQLELRSTVRYLRNSFASMRDGVVMVDEHGIIEWCNDAAQPLLGLQFPEDQGQTLTNLVREPDFNHYLSAGDYSQSLQYSPMGDSRVDLRVDITYFGEGERLLFVRDVSSSVRMEQVRRDFVGNVSHELRTPLTVITGYLGTFLSDPESFPAPYRKALQQMIQQAVRMENLLKDLLWLSRIESEQREEKRDLVDISALLEDLREELAATDPERNIALSLETDYKVPGDYRELYSAVSNLVNNAIKYSVQGAPVAIGWRKQGGEYRLSVRDQGLGIDEVHLPRLTERFYRVDDSRSSTSGGTGLGLAIVKHVAAAHEARLQIDSQMGEGSTFTLVFPERS